MRAVYPKIVYRSIRDSIVRFVAILAITALGVGFFAGLKVTMPSFIETGNGYVSEQKLFDLRLISTIGFTDDDVVRIASSDKISVAQGAAFKDSVVSMEDYSASYAVRFHTITDQVNLLSLEQGRMPESDEECVLDAYVCSSDYLGKKLKIEDTDGFVSDEYTVVGLVRSPLYMNFQRGTTEVGNGTLSFYAFVTQDALDYEYYSEVYVCGYENHYVYSDAYGEYIDGIKTDIENYVTNIEIERFDSIISDYYDEYYENKAKYDDEVIQVLTAFADGEEDISQAEIELEDAATSLNSAKEELDEAKSRLDEAKIVLDNSEEELLANKKVIDETQATFDASKEQIDVLKETLDEALLLLPDLNDKRQAVIAGLDECNIQRDSVCSSIEALEGLYSLDVLMTNPDYLTLIQTRDYIDSSIIELNSNLSEIDSGINQIDVLSATYDQAIDEYDSSYEQFEIAKGIYETYWDEYQSGRNDYYEGLDAYESGLSDYETALQDYDTGCSELSDGQDRLQRSIAASNAIFALTGRELLYAKCQIENQEKPEVFVLDRDTNVGYVCFENDAKIVDGIAEVFPLFFFAIAALVCSTTMQRMVGDERVQIGTMRAMGYSGFAIIMKYVLYSGLAALIGCVGGFIGGTKLFPYVIWSVYGMMYGFAPIIFKTDYLILLISLVVSLLCSVGATILTCLGEFTEQPAELVRQKSPASGKRILLERVGFIWRRLKFLHKVSARNVFRFKKRMWMMIVGIAGCTALVVTGFGLRDSIDNVVNDQYDEIMTYDMLLTFDDMSQEQIDKMLQSQDEKMNLLTDKAYAKTLNVTHQSNTAIRDVNLIVSSQDDITSFVNPHSGKESYPWPEDGKIGISSKLASENNLSEGDLITLEYGDTGESFTLEVQYVFDNYIFHYALINANTFEQAYGEEYVPTSVLLKFVDDTDKAKDVEYASDLDASSEDLKSYSALSQMRQNFDATIQQLNGVVVLVIACAAALAFIVLFNLNNINITERVREIATLKVLGFNRQETGSYVFRENFILVFIGFVFGIPLGILLHTFVMSQIKMDTVTFQIKILPISYVLSLFTVLLFSIIVDLVMRRKIERIDMAESLKSIE